MAYTAADVEALEDAIKSGVLRSRIGGRDVWFRSRKELEATKAQIERELLGTSRPKRVGFVAFNGGPS